MIKYLHAVSHFCLVLFICADTAIMLTANGHPGTNKVSATVPLVKLYSSLIFVTDLHNTNTATVSLTGKDIIDPNSY